MSSNSEAGGDPTEERRETAKGGGGGGGTDSNADISADAGGQHPLDHDELHYAIKRVCKRSFSHVQKLLDDGHEFCRGDGFNCFIEAAAERQYLTTSQRWEMLRKMLEVDPRGILVRDKDGQTLLNYFCNDFDKLHQLIDLGADLNNVTLSGSSLLESLLLPRLLTTAKNQEVVLKTWNLLIGYPEVKKQALNGNFFKVVAKCSNHSDVSKVIFFHILEMEAMGVEELTEKLEMHPLFFAIKNKVGLQLLPHILSDVPDKHLAPFKGDLSILDREGKTVVENLLCPRSSFCMNTEANILKMWDHLSSSHKQEIQIEISKDGFIKNLLRAHKECHHLPCCELMVSIFKLGLWSIERLTSELEMHPFSFLLKNYCKEPEDLFSIIDALEVKTQQSSILKKSILITMEIIATPYDYYRWPQKLKQVMLVTDANNIILDVIGFVLYKSKQLCSYAKVEKCLTDLLKRGFTPTSAAGVVSPIQIVLLKHFQNRNGNLQHDWAMELSEVLVGTMKLLKNAFSHQLVLDPKKGMLMLDLHFQLSLVLRQACARNEGTVPLINLILALLQLSPLHPLQHFTTLYYTFCHHNYIQQIINVSDRETFCKLLRLLLEASGPHKFQGVDQATIECIDRFCACLHPEQVVEEVDYFEDEEEEEEDWDPNPILRQPHGPQTEEISLMLQAAVKAESEVSSLQWLCILQIRKTLFDRRTNTTTTLPSLIRTLVAERRLPQGLEADVMVYKPNATLNF